MKLLLLILLIVLLCLYVPRYFIGFLAQKPADYAAMGPSFDPRVNLGGKMISEGILYGPKGRVVTSFVAEMNGDWQGDHATLTENFRYDSGTVQTRKWVISMGEAGAFTATADDILGLAHGQVSGSTLQMTYRLRLTPAAGGHVLDVVDWLYLTEDGTILNKSEMRKFGVKVAELVATIRPVAP
jgi:Protein of unknown function (DUF3833)